MVLEVVFVGQCEVFVSLDFVEIFLPPLAAKLISPRMERPFFFDTHPFNSVSRLTVWVWVLEIVFVRQCEVFVCIDFMIFFFLLVVKLIGL